MKNVTDLLNLKGKVAIVTGSATGIGQAIAVGLAEAGVDIAGKSFLEYMLMCQSLKM